MTLTEYKNTVQNKPIVPRLDVMNRVSQVKVTPVIPCSFLNYEIWRIVIVLNSVRKNAYIILSHVVPTTDRQHLVQDSRMINNSLILWYLKVHFHINIKLVTSH
jgi:hypothetical protein